MKTTMVVPRYFIALLMTAACAQQGGVGSVSSSGGAGGTIGSGSLNITSVYPTDSGSSWTPITASSRYYIKGLKLTIEGECGRGINNVKVSDGSTTYSEVAYCGADGTYAWSRTFISAEEGDKALTLTAYTIADNVISDATASLTVRIDNTAPAAPVISAPTGVPTYNHSGNSGAITISGTVSNDTHTMTGPGGVTVTPSSNAFSNGITMTEGATTAWTYYAFDLAGNQSAGDTLTITWSPNVLLYLAGAFPGGKVTDGGTSYSGDFSSYFVPSYVTDGGTSYRLETGINNIVNQVRAQ